MVPGYNSELSLGANYKERGSEKKKVTHKRQGPPLFVWATQCRAAKEKKKTLKFPAKSVPASQALNYPSCLYGTGGCGKVCQTLGRV